ncbi:hypothetical protein GE061_004508, partial [Apolygus lucorum]
TLWRKVEKAVKHTSPHVPNHLVSGEGGPKAAEPPRATPTTPETATFEDFQREEESPPPSNEDADKPALPSTKVQESTESKGGESEPLVESSSDPPLPEE